MKRKNTTRNALLTSIISMLLCVSMLVGATFAWFTDEVKSGTNVIAAGNLDVELYYSKTDDFSDKNKVDGVTKLFTDKNGNEIKHWEPGVVAYTNLQVANVGNLALKYQLSVNFSNMNYVDRDGKLYSLANALKVAVVDGGFTGDRAEAQALTNLVPLNSFVLSGELEGDETSNTYGIVIYWEPTLNDNLFNLNNGKLTTDGGKELKIDLGINLFATQEMYEEDSFGPDYDENAPYDIWDGVVPAEMPETLVVDGATQTIHVKDAAAFAYLSTLSAKWAEFYTDGNGTTYTNYANGAGADYYYSSKWTVSLEANIDLNNHPIEPVRLMIGESTGASAFKGNNHFIRNVNTTTGLFADNNRISYADLTLVNIKATNGALTGSSNTSIKNVTVKNSTISGVDYVGGLVGYIYGDVTNCKVVNSSVVGTKEVGGLIGYIASTSGENVVLGNEVNNVTVYANNRAAGLVAQVNVGVKVFNNIIDTVTVGAEDLTKYAADAVVSNALAPENVYNNTVVNANVLGTIDMVNKPEDLNDAITNAESGDTIILGDGEYSLPSLSNKEGITIDGGNGAIIGGENASTGFGGNFGKDTTIQNLTFTGGTNGVRYSYANGGTTTFENCTFAGDSTYGFHIDASNGATFIFNNCTFSGFNAFAGDLVKVVFNNCTFLHNGNYGHTNIWSTAEFNNCTFGDKASAGTRGDNAHLLFNGVEESYHHEYIGSAESLFAFAESVNEGGDSWSGQKVVLVADIDLEGKAWTPIGQTGSTQFKGMFDGQNHTIKNLNIDSSAQTGEYYATGLFGWLFNASVKNVNVDTATVVGGAYVGVIAGYLEWDGTTVENCHVTNATVEGKHVSNTRCGDKVGVIVGYAGNSGTPVKNCSATDCTVTAGRDAGQIVGAAKNANVVNCAATNVTVTASGDCTGANINNAIIGRNLG